MQIRSLKRLAQSILTDSSQQSLRRCGQHLKRLTSPSFDFGSFRRTRPFSRVFGYDRGKPIDRYYIEKFIRNNKFDIHGHILEIENDIYSRKYGDDRVTKCDILHVSNKNPKTTIIADLSTACDIPSDTFDCIIMTQTMQYIYDLAGTVNTLYRILKPAGVLLATVPGIAQVDEDSDHQFDDYWRFTKHAVQKLFAPVFSNDCIAIQSYGNVFAAFAFLYGLSVEDVTEEELEFRDPIYDVILTVRAIKCEMNPQHVSKIS